MFACDIDHSDSVIVPALRSNSSVNANVIQNTERVRGKGDVTSFSEILVAQFVDYARDILLPQEERECQSLRRTHVRD